MQPDTHRWSYHELSVFYPHGYMTWQYGTKVPFAPGPARTTMEKATGGRHRGDA